MIVDGDVSASAAIAESKLTLASDAAAGVASRRTLGTGALQAAPGSSIPTFVSALPGSPVDGQVVYYQSAAMATDGVVWALRYRSAAAGSYKWEFVGGSVWGLEVEGTGGYNSASPIDTGAPVGPGRTPPLAGDYEFAWGANFYAAAATNVQAHIVRMSDAVSMIAINCSSPASNQAYTFARHARITVVAAGVEYRMRYVGTAATTNTRERFLRIVPIRVG